MKSIMILGIVLVVLGLASLILGGISYTSREKVVDIGGLQVTTETRKTVPIPLIVGGLALVGGIAAVAVAVRKSRGGQTVG